MIADWRNFLGSAISLLNIVSLAAFMPHKDPPATMVADLRELRISPRAPGTTSGLASGHHVGNGQDIHPKEKKEIGDPARASGSGQNIRRRKDSVLETHVVSADKFPERELHFDMWSGLGGQR